LSFLEAKLENKIPVHSAVPSTPYTVVPEQILLAEGKVRILPELTLEFSEIWQEVKITVIINKQRFNTMIISALLKTYLSALDLIFLE
jgi:hypothetical protein